VEIAAGRQAGVPIPADQCPARLAAAEIAAGRRVADHAEGTPEADRMAALLVADTTTAK
jgi:hypothetical protein